MDDTNEREKSTTPRAPVAGLSKAVKTARLFQSPSEALKALREEYLYWTGKLTDTSLQLSYAVIAANWVVFGSVNKLLGNVWSKLSVSLVIVSLLLSVLGLNGWENCT